MKERKKTLHYAYATSPAAERLNNGDGCWLVDDGSGLPPIVYQDYEKWLALKMFEAINLPFNPRESMCRDSSAFNCLRKEHNEK